MTLNHPGKQQSHGSPCSFPASSQFQVLVCALILGIIVFAFLAPVVPVLVCGNPGCGGPDYDSITYYAFGVGWHLTFVSPDVDAMYGWIALAVAVMFFVSVGWALLLILRTVKSSPPTSLAPENSHTDTIDISSVRAAPGSPSQEKK